MAPSVYRRLQRAERALAGYLALAVHGYVNASRNAVNAPLSLLRLNTYKLSGSYPSSV